MSIFSPENNSNKNPNHHNYADAARDILETETLKETNFTDIYRKEGIEKDLNFIKSQHESGNANSDPGLHESVIQEYSIQQEIGDMDWFDEFSETDALDPEQKGIPIHVMLSSEYDDRKNHVDMVAVINNSLTNYKPVPFAIDATYNKDDYDLNKKMSWTHYRTKTPGVATVKYFDDTDAFEEEKDKTIPKGRIDTLPRFVVGFSPELSTKLLDARLSNDGWDSLARDETSVKAKWCFLTELKTQSEQMLAYYEQHNDTPELQKLQKQVAMLDQYFDRAIKHAKENDANHPDWINYASQDDVASAITSRTIC